MPVKTPTTAHYFFGDFELDAVRHRLTRCDGASVPLTPRVFGTLLFLVEHSNTVLDKERLMEAVWPDAIVEENNLSQSISILRRLLGDQRGAPHYIVTVPGRGYRFGAEVRATSNGHAEVMEPARPRAGKTLPANEPAITARLLPETARGRAVSKVGSRTIAMGAALALLLLVSLAVVLWRNQITHSTAPRPVVGKSIAVLPFANLSGNAENAYLAEGITDEIITRLAKVGSLKVISRTSTEKFKTAPQNVREIARQLGVANILEGSVQRSVNSVRITVQLIDATSDTHLWAESYGRELTDVFQVETEIAARVVAELEATLTRTEETALAAKPTSNHEAHQAYLKGMFFWNKRTNPDYLQAIEYFKEAVAQDPHYAEAHAGLAAALLFLIADNVSLQQQRVHQARASLEQAIALNRSLPAAHATAGLLAMNFDADWPKAEQEFRNAIALDGNYATAHQWYGEFLAYMGRFDEGLAQAKRAQELDPLSLIINTDLAKVYFIDGRQTEAIEHFNRALELDPDFQVAHGLLALSYAETGDDAKAKAQLAKLKHVEMDPMFLSWAGCVHVLAGRSEEARAVLFRLEALSHQTYVSPLWFAMLTAGLGENDQAFQWLERMIQQHAPGGALVLRQNRMFNPLRSDPRFAELLRQANLTP